MLVGWVLVEIRPRDGGSSRVRGTRKGPGCLELQAGGLVGCVLLVIGPGRASGWVSSSRWLPCPAGA
jgi:hypothetical protein